MLLSVYTRISTHACLSDRQRLHGCYPVDNIFDARGVEKLPEVRQTPEEAEGSREECAEEEEESIRLQAKPYDCPTPYHEPKPYPEEAGPLDIFSSQEETNCRSRAYCHRHPRHKENVAHR